MGDIGLSHNPAILSTVAAGLAAGIPQYQVAAQLGVHPSTVSRAAAKPDTKTLINTIHQALIDSALQPAQANISRSIQDYYSLPVNTDDSGRALPQDLQRKDHGFKASIRLLEAAGILPSHAQSILIQQIFNQFSTEIPEPVRRVFQQVAHNDLDAINLLSPETIDGEIVEASPTGSPQATGDNDADVPTDGV